jgi:hypothetical protein
VCAVCVLCAATAIALPAQTLKTLINLNGSDGANPYYMSLVQGTDGKPIWNHGNRWSIRVRHRVQADPERHAHHALQLLRPNLLS